MSIYNSGLFSKFTNSKKNGGAVEYHSDNVTLGVPVDGVLPGAPMFGNTIILVIKETGVRMLCIMDGQKSEYHDKDRTDLKAYVFVPTLLAAQQHPEYANISVRIALRD